MTRAHNWLPKTYGPKNYIMVGKKILFVRLVNATLRMFLLNLGGMSMSWNRKNSYVTLNSDSTAAFIEREMHPPGSSIWIDELT